MVQPTTSARRRSGATAVETAIVIGAALMFMLAIFEYGRFVMIGQVMQNAAREGARFAVAHTADQPPPNVPAYVQAYMAGQDVNLAGFSATVYQADTSGNPMPGNWYDAPFGQGIGVQVNGTYTPVVLSLLSDNTPVSLFPNSVAMQTKAVMFSEGN